MSQRNFWKNKRVLVTGHEGFLGSWVTRRLIDKGAKITGIDKVLNRRLSILKGLRSNYTAVKGDISDYKTVKKMISKVKPHIIYHLAAEALVGEANRNPLKAYKSNIEGTWNILEVARIQGKIEAIIVASSDKAYGEHKKLPYREDYALQGNHPYDVSKSCADLICNTYYHSYQVPVCITRCGNIYGPGDFNFSRIVPDGIRSLIQGRRLVIRSNGKFTRDYNYVEDIVEAYLLLGEKVKRKKLAGQAFNFSDGKPLSVLKLFNKIISVGKGKKIKPKILNQAQNEIINQHLSSQKAKRLLGWKAKTRLNTGLQKTIEWYKTHG